MVSLGYLIICLLPGAVALILAYEILVKYTIKLCNRIKQKKEINE